VIAFGVHLGCRQDQGFLAGLDAEMAFLAELPVDHDAGLHYFFPFLSVACRLQKVVKLRIKAFLAVKVKGFLASILDGTGEAVVKPSHCPG
jgi:hypothetical protein